MNCQNHGLRRHLNCNLPYEVTSKWGTEPGGSLDAVNAGGASDLDR